MFVLLKSMQLAFHFFAEHVINLTGKLTSTVKLSEDDLKELVRYKI